MPTRTSEAAPVRSRRSLATWLALAAAAGAWLVSALAILPSLADLLLFAVCLLVFTAPGWPLARWYAGRDADPITRTAFALLLGYAAGATIYVALRLVGVTPAPFVLLACAAAAVLLQRFLPADAEGFVDLPRLGGADRVGLGLLLLVVLAIVGPVFARVGSHTAGGLAYRAYFIADLFAHMSVVAELVKGAVPPVNPYYIREALPYYWGYFTLPAIFDWFRPALVVDRGILLTDLAMAPVLATIWYLAVRAFGRSALATATSWLVVILGTSYEGLWFILDQAAKHLPLRDVREVNIDALTRWYMNLPSFDGLQRIFWYTPQHATAITLGLVALVTFGRARRRDAVFGRGLVDGLALGTALVFSSFNGLMLVAWYALSEIGAFLAGRGRGAGRWAVRCALAAAVVVAYAGAAIGVGMIQKSAEAVVFGMNRHLMRAPWFFMKISFGPALFLAPFGLWLLVRRHARLALAVFSMLAVAAGILLYVEVVGHENTYVPFRTGQLFYLMLAFLLAFAIDQWRRWPRPAAVAMWVLLVAGTAAAFPTVAFDWYDARDITNVALNPGGFPWTVHITPDDQAAARWIQGHVPEDRTVQPDAVARGRATWALAPAFLRRRMAVGFALFGPNPARFADASAQVASIFATPDPAGAFALCHRLGIDYLYVGQPERARYGEAAMKFGLDTWHFNLAHREGAVVIYRVLHQAGS